MSAEENKAVIRRYFEASDLGFPDPEAVLAPGFVSHISSSDATQDGGEFVAWDRSWQEAVTFEPTLIEGMIAEGDRVAVKVTWRGVHNKGPLMGVPPTGMHIRVLGIAILRVVNGRVAERWLEFDGLGLMRQLQEGV